MFGWLLFQQLLGMGGGTGASIPTTEFVLRMRARQHVLAMRAREHVLTMKPRA